MQHLPPLSSDLREEGGSHTVLFSYKGSKGPSCPRRTDSVGRPSATEEYGQRGRIMGCQTGDWLIAGSMRHGLNPHVCKWGKKATSLTRRSLGNRNFVKPRRRDSLLRSVNGNVSGKREAAARWRQVRYGPRKRVHGTTQRAGAFYPAGWHVHFECVLHKCTQTHTNRRTHTHTHVIDGRRINWNREDHTHIKRMRKKITSLLWHMKLLSFSTFLQVFFCFSTSGVYTSLLGRMWYVSDSLLIGGGGNNKKQ